MDNLVYKRRYLILAVLVLAPFMGNLDSSVVNVALPVMARSLSVGISTIQWVVTGYILTLAALVLLFGKIADRVGKRMMFLPGFLIFGLGSLMCALSGNFAFLVLSRVVQASGSAMSMSSSQGLIAEVFPPNERGKALGLNASALAMGAMIGPPLGGFLVGAFSWQSIFFINLPVVATAFIAGFFFIPRDKKVLEEKTPHLDVIGSTVFIVSIISLFASLLSSEDLGWSSPLVMAGLAAGLVGTVVFVLIERHKPDPMVDLSCFHNRLFSVSIACSALSFACMCGLTIIQPFYLQYALGLKPATAGLIMLAIPVAQCFVAPVSGILTDRLGAEPLTVVGLVVMAAGLALMSTLTTSSPWMVIIAWTVVVSVGSSIFQSPNTTIIMGLSPSDKLGITGSINAEARNIGMVTGIALSVALLYNRMSAAAGYKVTSYVDGKPEIFIYGMRIVYLAAAALCALGVALTIARMRGRNDGSKGFLPGAR
jgi:EmrB/QacA subfamily drug resistance transporter